MYERYSEARNLMVQYWPESIFGTDLDMQNPYWIMNRMQNELSKRRYMFNASLNWDITDWVNVTGRVRVDNSDSDSYEKYYASTRGTFTESSSKGYYGHTKQNDRSVYADVMASINKNFFDDKLSLNATVGASINDIQEDAMYLREDWSKFLISSIMAILMSILPSVMNQNGMIKYKVFLQVQN